MRISDWSSDVCSSDLPIGSQTSYGNTGVLVENPWLVVNNPGLWKSLARIARNRDPRVRVDWRFVSSRLPLFAAFLARTSTRHADAVAPSLRSLLVVSQHQHKSWIATAGADGLPRRRTEGRRVGEKGGGTW